MVWCLLNCHQVGLVEIMLLYIKHLSSHPTDLWILYFHFSWFLYFTLFLRISYNNIYKLYIIIYTSHFPFPTSSIASPRMAYPNFFSYYSTMINHYFFFFLNFYFFQLVLPKGTWVWSDPLGHGKNSSGRTLN